MATPGAMATRASRRAGMRKCQQTCSCKREHATRPDSSFQTTVRISIAFWHHRRQTVVPARPLRQNGTKQGRSTTGTAPRWGSSPGHAPTAMAACRGSARPGRTICRPGPYWSFVGHPRSRFIGRARSFTRLLFTSTGTGTAGMFRYPYFCCSCLVCGRPLHVRQEHLGRTLTCLHCGGRFIARGEAASGMDGARQTDSLLERADRLLSISARQWVRRIAKEGQIAAEPPVRQARLQPAR